ncbi:MAG: hypothetical protein V5A62_07920 [Haloarculaceae archaeon]
MSGGPGEGSGVPDGDRPADEVETADASTGEKDPFESLPEADGEDPFESLPEADGEDPFERLDDGADPGERTPAEVADLFESVEVGAADDDVSWDELVSATGPTDGATDGVDPTTVEETVVPKRRYCQDCEYLTAPPEMACTHPDGEILEAVDVEHFRVRSCPVVAHRRERSIYGDAGDGTDDRY